MKCAPAGTPITTGALSSTTWKGCRDTVIATYTVIAGADHPWPGSVSLAPALQGLPSQALDASEAAWAFFKAAPAR